jgi:hypothetical protein
MTETTLQITVDELKKRLAESFLSDETKNAFAGVLTEMNDDEKTELIKIIEEGTKAKTDYEAKRLENLARLNTALQKHLQDSLREEEKYVRTQFEQMEHQEDDEELNNIEQQLKTL